ncbi:hypothetical protein [Colwellia sp. 20A7]|uniref:hypothetical protein n=1 Tax=Colwellia sp. 20A7 TaxID=2689569 RepID=UPI00135AEB61|nr:hypothetical protein [Colwellia sp. 20A7]
MIKKKNSNLVKKQKKKRKVISKTKKEKSKYVLGDKNYKPSKEEAEDFTKKANISHARLKMYIFYICFYKTYKMEPYNCKTLNSFIKKYLDISRSTVYRIYGVMCVRQTLKIGFREHNDIADAAFERLGNLGRIMGDEGLREFWQFLINETGEPITEKTVLFYIMQYEKLGYLLPKREISQINERLEDDITSENMELSEDDVTSENMELSDMAIEQKEKEELTNLDYLNHKSDINLLTAYQHSIHKYKSKEVMKVETLLRKLKPRDLEAVLSLTEDFLSMRMT